jgi:hypothetical protein
VVRTRGARRCSRLSDICARRESCRNSGLEHIHEFSWEAHCRRYFAVLDETLQQAQSLAGRQSIEPADITGAPVELVEAPPSERMLVLTMCSRDAHQAAKLLQRALACMASHALHLDTVAVVVASVLSAKVLRISRRAPRLGSDAQCLAGHAEHH